MAIIVRILLLTAFFLSCSESFCQKDNQTTHEEMKDFIYVLKLLPQYQDEANWTDEVTMIANSHFNYLKELHDNGQAIFVGRTDYNVDHADNFGIVIFKAKDIDDAQVLMSSDPAVKNGLMTAEVHPFKVVFNSVD